MKICSQGDCNFPSLTAADTCWVHLNNKKEWTDKLISSLNNPPYVFINSHLDGINFEKIDLTGSNFTGATLTNCNFNGAKLSKALLKRARCINCNFSGAEFIDSIWDGTVIRNCNLEKSNGKKVDWNRVKIVESNLFESYFIEADLRNALLIRINASSLKAPRLIADNCTFLYCNFADGMLPGAVFGGSSWIECDLSHIDLTYSNLVGAYFEKCNLSRAIIENSARITESTFFECDMSEMSFSHSIIRGSLKMGGKSEGIITDGAKIERSNLNNS